MGILQASILESPPLGDLSNPRIKPRYSTLQADSLLSEPPGKTQNCCFYLHFINDYWYKHLFMYLLDTWISSLEIVYSSLLPIFQLDYLWVLVLSCKIITYFGYQHLMRCVVGKYFLPCHMMSIYFWLFFLLCRSFLAWCNPTCLFFILLLVL